MLPLADVHLEYFDKPERERKASTAEGSALYPVSLKIFLIEKRQYQDRSKNVKNALGGIRVGH